MATLHDASPSALLGVFTTLVSGLLWDRKRMERIIDKQGEQLAQMSERSTDALLRVMETLGEVQQAIAELSGAVDTLKHLHHGD